MNSPADDFQAYLAPIPPPIQHATDYTHGSHWIVLFSVIVGVAINLLILRFKLLDRVRARRQQRGARPRAAALVISIVYYLAAWTLYLPWAACTKWWREVHYGLSRLSAGAWSADALVSAILSSIVVVVVLMLLYALMRRAPRTWWLWSSMVTAAVITGIVVIAPVALEHVVNHDQPLPAGVQRRHRAAGVAAVLSWLAIELVLLRRLYNGPALLPAVRPTLGIQLAPPAVGGVAYLALTDGLPDLALHMLLGYALLQLLLMHRMLKWIAALPFSMPFWGFSFGLTAIAQILLGMVARDDRGAGAALAVVLFIVANASMAWLIAGTLRLLVSGKTLPLAGTPTTTISARIVDRHHE